MHNQTSRTFSADFRRFFLRGLAVLLPSVLTLWILVYAYRFIDTNIAEPVNQGVRWSITQLTPRWEMLRREFEPSEETIDLALAERLRLDRKPPMREAVRMELRAQNVAAWWSESWPMDLIGLAIAIIAVYILGRLVGGYIGPRVYKRIEGLFIRLPLVKQVYPSVKQVVDFFVADKPVKFNSVVMVQYPSKGIWSMGFLTGPGIQAVAAAGESVTVFIPSSPAPFTGWTITVARRDLVELDITVDEAIRYLVSAGVLAPQQAGVVPPPHPVPVSAGEAFVVAGHERRAALAADAPPQPSIPTLSAPPSPPRGVR
jgi:uncharacterized membrane protein